MVLERWNLAYLIAEMMVNTMVLVLLRYSSSEQNHWTEFSICYFQNTDHGKSCNLGDQKVFFSEQMVYHWKSICQSGHR